MKCLNRLIALTSNAFKRSFLGLTMGNKKLFVLANINLTLSVSAGQILTFVTTHAWFSNMIITTWFSIMFITLVHITIS